jgi:signal transduction histidine kinase
LAAGIAHEINNPVGFVNSNMGALRNYVDTLVNVIDGYDKVLGTLPVNAAIAASIAQLKKQADLEFLKEDVIQLVKESMDGLTRVKDIVQSLKDFSHVGETDWQFADLHHGIDSTLTIANNEFKYKAVVVREFGTLPLVKCLASQLNQVFMNLIVNASHAIKESGIISIRTGCEGDWVWIEVGDNGAGIPAENLTRIFEPFFTTKPIGKGTGLGLSLSYNIIAKHGGSIEVESEIGRGTRFTIRLPVNGQGGT